jgi:hypothetical protein
MKLIAKPFKLPFSSDIVFNPFNKRILRKLDLFKRPLMLLQVLSLCAGEVCLLRLSDRDFLIPTFIKIETHFANLKFCDKGWKNLAQTGTKAGNRHEEISQMAYCHSFKRSINYICISGFSWLASAF